MGWYDLDEPKRFCPLPGITQDYNKMKKYVSDNSGNWQAFLVRLWRDGPQEPWRASAKEVANGREFFFASLEKLLLFLYAQTTEANNEQSAANRELLATDPTPPDVLTDHC